MTQERIDKRNKRRERLHSKNIVISVERYVHDTMYAMALALFSSIVMGVIFRTIGGELNDLIGVTFAGKGLILIGEYAGKLTGVAVGLAVAWVLRAPLLVVASVAAVGQMGAMYTGFGIEVPGGPFSALIAAMVGTEFGKLIYKETNLDHIITPAVTLLTGGFVAVFVGPATGWLLQTMGKGVMAMTHWPPILYSICIAVVMGIFLTLPIISSAAFALMIGLEGLPAGAAVAGCCAQMIGFAVIGYEVNGIHGILAQGLGTSMLQMSNIIRKPAIWIAPTVTAAIMGPVSTLIFHMTNNDAGAGMGTSGLIGQISALSTMGAEAEVVGKVILVHVILPAIIALAISTLLIKKGVITMDDYHIGSGYIRQKGI